MTSLSLYVCVLLLFCEWNDTHCLIPALCMACTFISPLCCTSIALTCFFHSHKSPTVHPQFFFSNLSTMQRKFSNVDHCNVWVIWLSSPVCWAGSSLPCVSVDGSMCVCLRRYEKEIWIVVGEAQLFLWYRKANRSHLFSLILSLFLSFFSFSRFKSHVSRDKTETWRY